MTSVLNCYPCRKKILNMFFDKLLSKQIRFFLQVKYLYEDSFKITSSMNDVFAQQRENKHASSLLLLPYSIDTGSFSSALIASFFKSFKSQSQSVKDIRQLIHALSSLLMTFDFFFIFSMMMIHVVCSHMRSLSSGQSLQRNERIDNFKVMFLISRSDFIFSCSCIFKV